MRLASVGESTIEVNGLAQTLEFVAQTAQPMPSEQSSCFITIGFVPWLWRTSDKLSNNMDAEEYQHLGLVVVECSFDTFEKHRTKFVSDQGYGEACPHQGATKRAARRDHGRRYGFN